MMFDIEPSKEIIDSVLDRLGDLYNKEPETVVCYATNRACGFSHFASKMLCADMGLNKEFIDKHENTLIYESSSAYMKANFFEEKVDKNGKTFYQYGDHIVVAGKIKFICHERTTNQTKEFDTMDKAALYCIFKEKNDKQALQMWFK